MRWGEEKFQLETTKTRRRWPRLLLPHNNSYKQGRGYVSVWLCAWTGVRVAADGPCFMISIGTRSLIAWRSVSLSRFCFFWLSLLLSTAFFAEEIAERLRKTSEPARNWYPVKYNRHFKQMQCQQWKHGRAITFSVTQTCLNLPRKLQPSVSFVAFLEVYSWIQFCCHVGNEYLWSWQTKSESKRTIEDLGNSKTSQSRCGQFFDLGDAKICVMKFLGKLSNSAKPVLLLSLDYFARKFLRIWH